MVHEKNSFFYCTGKFDTQAVFIILCVYIGFFYNSSGAALSIKVSLTEELDVLVFLAIFCALYFGLQNQCLRKNWQSPFSLTFDKEQKNPACSKRTCRIFLFWRIDSGMNEGLIGLVVRVRLSL